MKLLVTGASGQLGRDVLEAAARDKISAVGLSRADLDLEKPDSVADALRGREFDALVNCAGYTRVDDAESDPQRAFTVNARGAEALALACRAAGARFLHISTDYVFDGRLDRPYRETDPPAPLSVYGASKLMGEALTRHAWPDGTIIVRTASLFGTAAAERGSGNFIETIVRAAGERGRLRVVADMLMSPTLSADLAPALLRLLDADAGVYHVVNSGQATWHELACAALELAGSDVEVEPVASHEYAMAATRPAFSVLDTSKASALIGELPPWRDALERYMRTRRTREATKG